MLNTKSYNLSSSLITNIRKIRDTCKGTEMPNTMTQHIQKVLEKHIKTQSTIFVPDNNKLRIKDSNFDLLELPIYCTFRSVYCRFY